jgi:hypothetical protein
MSVHQHEEVKTSFSDQFGTDSDEMSNTSSDYEEEIESPYIDYEEDLEIDDIDIDYC